MYDYFVKKPFGAVSKFYFDRLGFFLW